MNIDYALAESVIGLYKTDLIKPRGPWRTAEEVEIATMHYIDWLNHQRLFETCGADDLATAVTRDGQGSNR